MWPSRAVERVATFRQASCFLFSPRKKCAFSLELDSLGAPLWHAATLDKVAPVAQAPTRAYPNELKRAGRAWARAASPSWTSISATLDLFITHRDHRQGAPPSWPIDASPNWAADALARLRASLLRWFARLPPGGARVARPHANGSERTSVCSWCERMLLGQNKQCSAAVLLERQDELESELRRAPQLWSSTNEVLAEPDTLNWEQSWPSCARTAA